MAVLDDMDAKLDQLIAYTKNEVNLEPDLMRAGAFQNEWLKLTNNMSVNLNVHWEVIDKADAGRWLCLQLRDPYGTPVITQEWKCVLHNYWNTGEIRDKPTS
jgi:hypothetical protein